jgi:hypothetical protein
MSTFSRNLPVIALAIAVAVALYVLYQRTEALSASLELVATDTRHILEYIEQMPFDPPQTRDTHESKVVHEAQTQTGEQSDAKSVDDDDVEVVDDGLDAQAQATAGQVLPNSIERYLQDSADAASDPKREPPSLVTLAGQLLAAASVEAVTDTPAVHRLTAEGDDDKASVASGSTTTTLASSNHKPPIPAKNFPVGHRHLHTNGRMFEVIKTKNGQIRWGAPRKPPEPEQESKAEAEVS